MPRLRPVQPAPKALIHPSIHPSIRTSYEHRGGTSSVPGTAQGAPQARHPVRAPEATHFPGARAPTHTFSRCENPKRARGRERQHQSGQLADLERPPSGCNAAATARAPEWRRRRQRHALRRGQSARQRHALRRGTHGTPAGEAVERRSRQAVVVDDGARLVEDLLDLFHRLLALAVPAPR